MVHFLLQQIVAVQAVVAPLMLVALLALELRDKAMLAVLGHQAVTLVEVVAAQGR